MVRPRWQSAKPTASRRFWLRWDRTIAAIAAVNLTWVVFDVTYVPLRNFWLQRTLYPLPTIGLAVPLPWLPNLTKVYDRVKGIEPHPDTESYLRHFQQLEATAASSGINSPAARQLRLEMVVKSSQLIDENPFVASNKTGSLEKLKSRLRARADMDSAKQSAAYLLGESHLTPENWDDEKRFWQDSICLLYTSPSPRDGHQSRMPSSA